VRRHLVLFAAASALLVSCGGDDDDGGGGEAAGDYCDALAAVKAASDEAAPTMEDGEATPAETEEAFTLIQGTFEDWEAAAPEEIADDVELIVDTTDQFVDALAAVDFDVLQLDEETMVLLSDPETTEAQERVNVYGQEQCGITINEQ
jgi:hypothetical protein